MQGIYQITEIPLIAMSKILLLLPVLACIPFEIWTGLYDIEIFPPGHTCAILYGLINEKIHQPLRQ